MIGLNILKWKSLRKQYEKKKKKRKNGEERDNAQQLEAEYQLGHNAQISSTTTILESENQQQGSHANDEWMTQSLWYC